MRDSITPQRDVFSVSRLNMEVRSALEGSFPLLWVSGEITNLAMPRSGHLYLTLKDAQAQVRAALFRNKRNLLRFQPENGMQVIVRARVTLYEPRGDFQLIIEHMEIAGEGALRAQVEALKQKLDAEGLFAQERKRILPHFPQRIGVMTSASGAALHDVLTVLKRRNPMTSVILYPVTVQGATAAAEMTRMLEVIAQRDECDLLIVTRGGGSLEDLMPFNDEQLVRAVADLPMPVISAVGHEIDTTLCDFVADQRAPTPSAAAEVSVRDQREMLALVMQRQQELIRLVSRQLQRQSQTLDFLGKRLDRVQPGQRIRQVRQQLFQARHQLERQLETRLKTIDTRLHHLHQRLNLQSPRRNALAARQALEKLEKRLQETATRLVPARRQLLATLAAPLHALSPLETLQRGYAIAFDANAAPVKDASRLQVDDQLRIRFAKGSATCRVESTSTEE